ncbi:MAG: hypothetical protein ACLGH0_07005 [Thermoanaerobaculia bacterium]
MRTLHLTLTLLLAFTASADLIVPQTYAPRILIPVAGDTPGQNGTHFRSDIQIINFRNAAQRVQLYWLPQGGSGSAIAPRNIDLGALSGLFSENFVANVMNQTGVGAIEIVGVTGEGVFDPNARLHATARIWTPQPDGEAGTMSQTFPAVIVTDDEPRTKAIHGLRRSTQYRLNVGIANPSNLTGRYRVTVRLVTSPTTHETSIFDIELQPRSIAQRSVTLSADGIAQITIDELTAGGTTDYHAWASSVDNDSGDAWSQMAFPVIP